MSKKQLPRKQPNPFIRFSNIGFQMAATIGLGAWGGSKLDERYQTKKPYFTIVLSLLGIAAALYLVIKDVLSQSKDEEDK